MESKQGVGGDSTVFQNPLDDAPEVFEPSTGRSAGASLPPQNSSIGQDILEEEEERGDDLGVMTIASFGVNLGVNVTKGTRGTLQSLGPVGGSPRAQKVTRQELRKLFDEIDVDGGGTLDAAELRELIHGLGVHLTEAELAATVQEMVSSVRRIAARPCRVLLLRMHCR